jgi:hypothetical protein
MATAIGFTRPAGVILSFATLAGTAQAQCNLFDPVYATMTQERGGDSPGCRGCHIAPQPEFGPWFGDTEEDVLNYFLNTTQGRQLVSGARQSRLARALGLVDGIAPYMPRDAPLDGRFWVDDPDQGLTELTDLGNWLDTIDFQAVLTQ